MTPALTFALLATAAEWLLALRDPWWCTPAIAAVGAWWWRRRQA